MSGYKRGHLLLIYYVLVVSNNQQFLDGQTNRGVQILTKKQCTTKVLKMKAPGGGDAVHSLVMH